MTKRTPKAEMTTEQASGPRQGTDVSAPDAVAVDEATRQTADDLSPTGPHADSGQLPSAPLDEADLAETDDKKIRGKLGDTDRQALASAIRKAHEGQDVAPLTDGHGRVWHAARDTVNGHSVVSITAQKGAHVHAQALSTAMLGDEQIEAAIDAGHEQTR